MVVKLSWAQKRVLWTFEKGNFQFFADFWVRKWRPFSGKLKQSVQNCFSQNLVIGSFLENGFEATMSSKTSVVSGWKEHFLVVCKFFIKEVETNFSEIEAKHSKLFKWKFGHRKLLRKYFWSYLELKNECCDRLKRALFSFLQILEWQSWKDFLGKWGKRSTLFK